MPRDLWYERGRQFRNLVLKPETAVSGKRIGISITITLFFLSGRCLVCVCLKLRPVLGELCEFSFLRRRGGCSSRCRSRSRNRSERRRRRHLAIFSGRSHPDEIGRNRRLKQPLVWSLPSFLMRGQASLHQGCLRNSTANGGKRFGFP